MNAGNYFHHLEKLGTIAVKCFFEKELDKCLVLPLKAMNIQLLTGPQIVPCFHGGMKNPLFRSLGMRGRTLQASKIFIVKGQRPLQLRHTEGYTQLLQKQEHNNIKSSC